MTADQQTYDAPVAAPEPPAAPPPTGTMTPPAAPEPPERKRGGAGIGIVLIVVGVLLLLAQFMPGVEWWSMWPLIIVAVGLVQIVTPGKDGWSIARVFEGLVTIAWGLVFLAITIGLVTWGVMYTILSMWPVLLIAIGFELLAKAVHIRWLSAIGSIVVIAALAFAVSANITGTGEIRWLRPAGDGDAIEVSEPVGQVDSASLKIAGGVADMTIDGDTADLIEARAESPFGTPAFEADRTGDEADLSLTLGGSEGTFIWPNQGSAGADISLSDAVLWDLVLETGAATIDADLSDLDIALVDLRLGASDVQLKMGEGRDGAEPSAVDVRAGVSSVSLEFPEDAEIRVESNSGLTGHSMGGRLESIGGGIWETPGYDDAEKAGDARWLVMIRSGVGAVDVGTY